MEIEPDGSLKRPHKENSGLHSASARLSLNSHPQSVSKSSDGRSLKLTRGMRREVMPAMCGTCPFREGSPHADLADMLRQSALTEASRYCHSTGKNALYGNTHKLVKYCRGARNEQLQMFHRLGFLSEPTDAAWNAKCEQLGI